MKFVTTLSIFSASCLLNFHAFAADMDAASVISTVQASDKSCVQGALKLPIRGLKIGTSAARNQVQADNGGKHDGVKGKNYSVLSTTQKAKLIPFASYGPLESRGYSRTAQSTPEKQHLNG